MACRRWRFAANEKPKMSRYLLKNTKTGDFNTQRTLSRSFFVIPEHLASIHAVVLVFTANKQTNTLNYIYLQRQPAFGELSLLWRTVNNIPTMVFL